ncbi:hypothetical protein OROMI_029618 [Orobanche minor]
MMEQMIRVKKEDEALVALGGVVALDEAPGVDMVMLLRHTHRLVVMTVRHLLHLHDLLSRIRAGLPWCRIVGPRLIPETVSRAITKEASIPNEGISWKDVRPEQRMTTSRSFGTWSVNWR